jgi:Variant SH3 domain
MIVVSFQDGRNGPRRTIRLDLVGGRNLHADNVDQAEQGGSGLLKWWWYEGDVKMERLVTKDVAATAPGSVGSLSYSQSFPPDGGLGLTANAVWSWYTKAEDELLFPKGAEIREMEDVNGDWFFGCYMGSKGLFPAPYVKVIADGH